MHDARLDKVADVLVRHSAEIQPGEKALINASTEAIPLAVAVARQVIAAGGFAQARITVTDLHDYVLTHGSEDQLRYVPRSTVSAFAEADKTFHLTTANHLQRLLGSLSEARRAAFYEGQQTFQREKDAARKAAGSSRKGGACCGDTVVAPYPTTLAAERAGMTLREYEEFVFDACLPDAADPVGYWQALQRRQQGLIDALDGTSTLRVIADGTDLRLGVAGRAFVNASGQSNLPDGEIYVGPVEGSAEGHIRFTLPTFWQGVRIEGLELVFKNGRVVAASASVGDAALQAALAVDNGARNVGEFAIGTNPGIHRTTGDALFDEKIAGTFHVALGRGLAGNTNMSMIHWDLVSDLRDGGEIYADGRLVYRDGEFIL